MKKRKCLSSKVLQREVSKRAGEQGASWCRKGGRSSHRDGRIPRTEMCWEVQERQVFRDDQGAPRCLVRHDQRETGN